MLGLFDRYLLVLEQTRGAERGVEASSAGRNGDSFILDWSLDTPELESSSTSEIEQGTR